MSIVLKTARLAVPVLFFGYGIFANAAMLAKGGPDLALPENGLLSGGLTADFDGAYKKDLPHMDLALGVIGAARFTLLGEARQGALVGADGWLFTAEEARALPTPDEVARIVATVQDVQNDLAAVGTRLVVVPLPAKVDIYRDKSPDPALGDALAGLYADFLTSLSKRGIAVVDARQPLLTDDAETFLATDTHWTPEGAERVAEAVAAAGIIESGDLAFDQTEAKPITLSGDLVKFVTTPDRAAAVGLAPETVTRTEQAQTGAQADIFGAGGPDIVLVGTSYSANPNWGFADALMRTLGRDVVSLAENGLGPLRPMQDYLARDGAAAVPASVVIWEIPVRYLTDPSMWPTDPVAAPTVAGLSDQENSDG